MVTAKRMCMAAPLCGGGGPEDLPLPAVHERRHLGRRVAVVLALDLDDLPAAHFHCVERCGQVLALPQEQYDALLPGHAVRIAANAVVQGVPLGGQIVGVGREM